MTDRLAGAPGRYSATIALDEIEKLKTGENFSITLVRDDDPIVEGTPYSKAAVLPDALAEVLCPDIDDPTPADALFALLNLKSHVTEDADHPGCFYRIVNGVQEWVNPPMELGVEYRTTERWLGKVVYTKLFDFGLLPEYGVTPGNLRTVYFTDSEANTEGIQTHEVIGRTGTGGAETGTTALMHIKGLEYVHCSGNKVTVRVTSEFTYTNTQAYIQAKYVKRNVADWPLM